MTNPIDENLKKSIKKNNYAKAQVAKIIFPPGLGAVAFDEAKTILASLWFAKKFTGDVYLLKNEIQVRPVYLFATVELLLRNHCFSDVRLVIFKETVIGKKAFEKRSREICWDHYINKQMTVKIKVNSVASHAFHETSLKEIMTAIVRPYVNEVVSGENSQETTCLYVELYKDKLTISISLAGQPLYKRGYRGSLSASAPLREDAAASCIQKALSFAKKYDKNFLAETILIPFSGTGTFAFEYCQRDFKFIPALLTREYALKKMPLFKQANFDFLVNKAKEECLLESNKKNSNIICIDHSSDANFALEENIKFFKQTAEKTGFNLPAITCIEDDFFKLNFDTLSGDVFMPLNPPYGIRLSRNSQSVSFYKRIAEKINEISSVVRKKKHRLLGFILCPTEEAWSSFVGSLIHAETKTYHFTQGGLDIRVCQFFV